ncbi:MAG: hypothetical protein JW760_04560 [Spirochaetales bacterium]|nr:hypothetical protein [Spirochaetales bacterium]
MDFIDRIMKVFGSLLFLFLFLSCGHNDTVHLLENDWFFSTEEDNGAYTPFDVSTIKSLPRYLDDGEGILFLKTEFSIPASYNGQMLSLFLGRIEIADKAYLNGQLIGETGRFPPEWFNDWNMDRRYDVPPSIIRWDSKNELLLKIYVNRSGLISGDLQIGPKNQIDDVYSVNSLFHRQINLFFSFLLIVFGLNSILLYSKRKQEKAIFWFSLVSISFAFSQAGIFLTSLPGFQYTRISYIPFMKMIGILEIAATYCFLRFTRSFFHIKKKSYVTAISFIPSIFLMIAFLLQVNYSVFYGFYNLFEMSLSIPCLYIVYIAFRARIEKRRGAGLFITTLIPISLLYLHDMFLTNVVEGYIVMMGGIGLPFMLIIINIVFGLDLVKDRNKAETLNLELDETISRHIHELKDTSNKLSYSSRRYNFIHTFKLSAREREILGFIIDGQSNDEIADTLDISIRTVSAHLYKIYKKINLHSRMEIFAAFNKPNTFSSSRAVRKTPSGETG